MNWIMATEEVFKQYLGEDFKITTERQLSNGQYIKHFELAKEITGRSHLDNRVTMFTEEAMREYVRFVEGDA